LTVSSEARRRSPSALAALSWPRHAESVAAAAACALAALAANWRVLRPEALSADALVHLYWMWRYRDPQLFGDPLTAELRRSARYPDGYEALLRLATEVVDPILFGEWLGIGLMAASGWLVFAIVREHTPWRPAAWLGAGLFLALIEIHRFYGGFPRAFVQPVVLLTVLLALRRRELAAALCAGGGALFYPPASVLAVGVLFASSVRRSGIDRRRAAFAVLALALLGAAVLLGDGGSRVLTAAEARAFPEFGEHGTLHFFAPSLVEYLSQNRSGFDLRTSGSILVLAGAALLLVRRGNIRLLRAEVLALPVVSLAAFGLAQAVLFRLYLPHRYTYPLVAFFAIAVAVTLRPTWLAFRTRPFLLLAAPAAVAALAVYVFPLAPPEPEPSTVVMVAVVAGIVVAAALVALRRPTAAAGTILTGVVLIGLLVALPGRVPSGTACPQRPVTRYLAGLPKDAVVAGDPRDLMCVPVTARRAVVISTQLAPSYEADYFRTGRERMFAMLRAYYGTSRAAIADLADRYGATDLWVRRDAVRRELAGNGKRWRADQQPYGSYVRRLVARGEPAVLSLPADCRRFSRGPVEVYEIACLTRRPARARTAAWAPRPASRPAPRPRPAPTPLRRR
jgi:hypothetical protein